MAKHPWARVCERQYRQEIERHAETVKSAASLDWWVRLSREWIEHFVAYTTKAMRLADAERKALADACVRAFNEIYLQLLERFATRPAVA